MPHLSVPSRFRNQTRPSVSAAARGPNSLTGGPVPDDEDRRAFTQGAFELVAAEGGGVLIRLLDSAGALLVFSRTYPDLAAAVLGVEAVRECAATAHITDRTAVSRQPGGTGAGAPGR